MNETKAAFFALAWLAALAVTGIVITALAYVLFKAVGLVS
jgi:hypothetical protein